MANFEFSVIKYVPDIVRFEPVNIGISLLDKQNKKMHNKYITNFNAFFKRLGVDNIYGLERSFENYKPILDVDNDDYLWKLHDSFHGSIFYSEPMTISVKDVDITLQQVFDKMISIPKGKIDIKETVSITTIRTKVKNYVAKLKFPENTYQEKFEIENPYGIPLIRDFAFMKNNELINTIDVFNFSETGTYDSLKLFLYEIKAIVSSTKHPKNKPLIFGTTSIQHAELSHTSKQSVELVNMHEIQIISPEYQEETIQKIHSMIA